MNSRIKYFSGIAIAIFGIISYLGMMHYPGSPLVYVGFCFSSLLIILEIMYRPSTISYSFLIIFLSLGFWTKVTLHLWLSYGYLEPTGLFDYQPASWDQVLIISSTGLLGVFVGKAIFSLFSKGTSITKFVAPPAPAWYSSTRRWLWGITFISTIGIAYLNWAYGLAQIGITPKTILPWPLNGLTSWLLGFGFIALILTLAGWDHAQKRHWCVSYTAMLIEAVVSTASSLSRATFLFHSLPYMIVLFTKRLSSIFNRKCMLALTIWAFFFVISLALVMGLRYGTESPVKASGNQSLNTSEPDEFILKLIEKTSLLIVDRWIGIEGVMAVSAYPDKNFSLLESTLVEKRVRGQMDFYTSNIAAVHLSEDEQRLFQYASIPGGVAFFYYSGSLLVVFFGMAGLVLILIASERVVVLMTQNSYLGTFWSMSTAHIVAGFGLGIIQQLTYSGFCLLTLGCIGVIQRTAVKHKLLPQV